MKKVINNIWMTISYPLLHVSAQVVVSLVIMFVISLIVGFNMGMSGEAVDPNVVSQQVTEKMNVNLIAVISALLTFLVIFLINRKKGKAKETYNLRSIRIPSIIYIITLAVAFYIFIGYTLTVTKIVELFPDYEETMKLLLGNSNFFLEFLSIVLLAPILEEVVYRNMVLGKLRHVVSIPLAIIIQGFLFGLVHGNILQGGYAFIIGCLFGLLFIWTNSLWGCILAHMVFNFMGFIASRQAEVEGELNTVVGIVMILISLAVSVVMIILIRKGQEKAVLTD